MPLILTLAKSAFGSALSWLSHRSFWQLVSMGLAVFALVQHFQIAGERRHSHKLQAQVEKQAVELKRISTTKNEQRVITKDRIVIAEQKAKSADTKAKAIEAAPLPGQCRTPKKVLDADI